MTKRGLFFLITVLLFVPFGKSQNTVSSDLEYIDYLVKNDQLDDAIFFLKKINSSQLSKSSADSVNYYYGMTYHYLKNADTAALFLGKIDEKSGYYVKSRFYQSLNNMFVRKYDEASNNIINVNLDSSLVFNQCKILQLAGINLLNGKTLRADSLIQQFDYAGYIYSNEQKSVKEMATQMKQVNKKTPLKAALLSAVVPGLGKFYAGKKGQALVTMFSTIGIGLLAFENYYRGGVKSPQFIVSGTVFTIFYFGNIVGSAYSVKSVKRKNKLLRDYAIETSLHRTVMRLFN